MSSSPVEKIKETSSARRPLAAYSSKKLANGSSAEPSTERTQAKRQFWARQNCLFAKKQISFLPYSLVGKFSWMLPLKIYLFYWCPKKRSIIPLTFSIISTIIIIVKIKGKHHNVYIIIVYQRDSYVKQ